MEKTSKMIVREILDSTAAFRKKIADLKTIAPNYPEILVDEEVVYEWGKMRKKYWATTMVEFSYNDIRFKRHHVQEITETDKVGKQAAIDRINHEAELCKQFAIPCEYDTVIGPNLSSNKIEIN